MEVEAQEETVVKNQEELETTTENNEEVENQEPTEVEEEEVISFGNEDTPPQDDNKENDPNWLKDFRKQHKETVKEKKELERRLAAFEEKKEPVSEKPKPTLEGCGWDESDYEGKLLEWNDNQRKVKVKEEAKQQDQQRQVDDWNNSLANYENQKQTLKVANYDDSEDNVKESLTEIQQGIIVTALDKPAHFIYAIGKDSKTLKELSSVTDPVKFAVKIAKLETQLKVTKRESRQPETQPERVLNGGGGGGSLDNALAKARKTAETTGDYSEVTKIKQQIKKG